MIDSECDVSKSGEENHFNLQECHVIKELEEELELCKADQNDIRSKLETLCDESNNAMRNFSLQLGCCNKVCYDKDVQNEVMQNEETTNLKEQIALLEAEKKSAALLWQICNNDTLRIDQQTRNKWHLSTKPLQIGDLVLILDERYPPAKWPLARVTALHPGTDGRVRVVTVRTAVSEYKRPIVKLCPLPIAT
ncbi:unnamed protein product [Lasius platythorax]